MKALLVALLIFIKLDLFSQLMTERGTFQGNVLNYYKFVLCLVPRSVVILVCTGITTLLMRIRHLVGPRLKLHSSALIFCIFQLRALQEYQGCHEPEQHEHYTTLQEQ
jgi:hypothetical protein